MSENSERYFLKEVANLEKTQTSKGTDSGTLRRPLQDSLQSERNSYQTRGKNLNYGGKKIGKEIETLESTLHGAKSELQGQTEEANREKGSGTGQGRLCGSQSH